MNHLVRITERWRELAESEQDIRYQHNGQIYDLRNEIKTIGEFVRYLCTERELLRQLMPLVPHENNS